MRSLSNIKLVVTDLNQGYEKGFGKFGPRSLALSLRALVWRSTAGSEIPTLHLCCSSSPVISFIVSACIWRVTGWVCRGWQLQLLEVKALVDTRHMSFASVFAGITDSI